VDCSNCGAPLPAKSHVCIYCRTLNETDLRTARQPTKAAGTGDRDCPRCTGRKLAVLQLPGLDSVEVDRCETCHGIFFDPGELERAMNRTVRPIAEVDRQELERLINEERKFEKKVVYLRCPECKQLMDRRIHGRKSGVVVDRCIEHGIWLDGGELRALLKWAAAGGREHTADQEHKERVSELERARARAVVPDRISGGSGWKSGTGNDSWLGGIVGEGLLEVLGMIGELFG